MTEADGQFCWLPEFAPDSFQERAEAIARAGEFGATYQVDGVTHSYAALAPVAAEAHEQLALDLPGYSERGAIRRALADKIQRDVVDGPDSDEWMHAYPERLRLARQEGASGIRLKDGKLVVYWDNKAGLARLCPDDAREDAMRLRRRVQPHVEELRKGGHRLLYAVFTMPNFERGKLREGMRAIIERFKASVLKAKRDDGELMFPQIKGALVVLEAPLGVERDWNIHLNVILPVKGFLDFGELRARWHWNVEMRWIPDAPGAFESAFAELIKYSVAATVAKSAEHADDGRSRAPPMLEWRPDELVEWLRAMHGFRRTRGYGALYGLAKPEIEEAGTIVWIGKVSLVGGRYLHRCTLLDSIPEDKFSGMSATERWQALVRALVPHGLTGAGSIGESAPSLRELSA